MTTQYTHDGPVGPSKWDAADSENLARANSGIWINVILVAIADLILAAGLVLGILGYYGITDRLDQVVDNTTVVVPAPSPVPAPSVSPTPTQ